MDELEVRAQIAALEAEIAALPIGSLGKKTINGKQYDYHRWYEGGVRKEQSVRPEEAQKLKEQIARRKALEAEVKLLRRTLPKRQSPQKASGAFTTNVLIGDALRSRAHRTSIYKKRECFQQLHDFLYANHIEKVFVLCGLRRTGKTTMIWQAIDEMDESMLLRTAFVQITPRNTLAHVNQDLKQLETMGYRYVFFDEVTLMEDFIEGAALFSDVFAACGMKIVLSGTDSLGFLFTEKAELYDRCIMLHTTFIPYREFESILGIRGIDEYIRYGGTMSLSGVKYNEQSTFSSKASTDEYVDSAIAQNIQHSLRCYQYGGHFRHLEELHEKDELTSAINRVVEDINHSFTLEVLTRDFVSHDLALSARNLRKDREDPNDILDQVDVDAVTQRLRQMLEIRNSEERTVALTRTHSIEIQEYLALLDLIQEVEIASLPNVNDRASRVVISQPGMRYCQAEALIKSLMLDETFSDLSLGQREEITARILSEVRGRMMEDIVLLETKLAHPKKQVFILQFPVGEFDMVISDPQEQTCRIFEIKHSTEAVPQQYRHLSDEEKCADTAHRYGKITGKYVLYRGPSHQENDIIYQNVEEYLKALHPGT